MKLTIREIHNSYATNYKDVTVKSWDIVHKTEKECFTEAYNSVRSNRYCTGYRIEFKDPEVQKRFRNWQKTDVTMEMYYGNATVD